MITLTQNIKLKGYQVQATLRKREQNHPFIAVLMLPSAQNGQLTTEKVHKHLLPALPAKAAKNLLDRLLAQGYFTQVNEDTYELTDLGWRSGQQQEVWTQMEGLYDFYLVDSPLVPQRIISMKEITNHLGRIEEERSFKHKNGKNKNKRADTQRLPTEMSHLEGNHSLLGSEKYLWEKFEKNCFPLPEIQATLTIIADPKKGVSLEIKGNGIHYKQDLPDYAYEQIRQDLLMGEFGDLYVPSHDWVSVGFSSQQLDFFRKAEIRNPRIEGMAFNPIYLDQVSHQPDDQDTAQQWFETLLTRRMGQYFFSEEDFQVFQKKIRDDFRSYSPELLSREEMLEILQGQSDSFYTRMKLLAPMLLS